MGPLATFLFLIFFNNFLGGFHIQGDTATEKLIWAFNQNSNQFLLILKLIIFDTYPIQLD